LIRYLTPKFVNAKAGYIEEGAKYIDALDIKIRVSESELIALLVKARRQ